ncbi:DUF4433 domain-containing protein [Sulfitobacter pseudonitzschiae]|uniref:DUF4433 domain-containing protein n=1 Tax=Pseudosulfitobacter pseudonitzschiae TaxID=1402135 RepID=A0A9Q2P5G2_9RHOB|nr:DarT ssDNA thymidine ADP-ribosyltransferase family protein [Pseudosulfitobacter pseudonitzschiae]MBM2294115.1 DUF4433 domain-containing protein [Pseudosulfitobacter pseudonitzschiae]MBM2299039.1 DUF4433 domain-containing protein [Pseudosulfitobacter pseudonitzschiae]MBM2303947.1 DUF4433 domain-containing protein [Pseudosulfitobacter pseudonitzschiae]MBM2313728.1 DUF4433 domain-containing protein [Pseudosulfitobacter pseudonitzschiae]MBM2318643.1 DUF4433 domain-containing protein [Pseudosulf
MEILLFLFGLVLILAAIDKLKLFGAARKTHSSEAPLTIREKAAGTAAIGGDLTRGTIREVKKLPAAIDEFNDTLKKQNLEAETTLSQIKSPFGRSLAHRRMWLARALETEKHQLKILDKLNGDDELRHRYEVILAKLRREEETVSNKNCKDHDAAKVLRDLGFSGLPANLRLISIPLLCHFTRIENLQSILEQGIVPVGGCPELNIHPVINDENRFDRRTNTSSLSIGHPNERMLYKYRKINPDSDWVVLAINPATALSLDTLFCPHNAADARIRRLPDSSLRGNLALQAMFDPREQYTGSVRYNQPADTQAEILIPRGISAAEIQGVFFLSEQGYEKFGSSCGNRAVFTPSQSKAIFGKRIDRDCSSNARIIRDFDFQIDELIRDFKNDHRLPLALDKKIMSETEGAGSVFGHLMRQAWIDYSQHGKWVHGANS